MRTLAILLLLAAAVCAGCAAPLATTMLSGSHKPRSNAEAVDQQSGRADEPKSAAVRKATSKPLTQEQSLSSVLHELQEIRAMDPEAERELMADLEEAKPEHYPMIVDTFRTALAYRQQLAERQHLALASESEALVQQPAPPPEQVVPSNKRRPREVASQPPEVEDLTAAITASDDNIRYASHEEAAVNENPSPLQPTATRPAPTARALYPTGPAEPLAAAANADVVPTRSAEPGDWHAQLDAAIAELQRTANPRPGSIDELRDHMRLRTLQLLAGREEDAYRPIPGASAAQQDYWSKQLFAMSAYLNGATQLDDKQRAAVALAPLDEARAKLSELATLQIRNAAFVASVDGFGAYESAKVTSFQPGQKVTLYAEVENFRSNSAEDGYHTSLSTSYQVLDKTGRRVDGKQFPDVEDQCRNRRRDFHMQYEFPLPTRIYPDEYNLELTITDHNSGKIGQATIPFEIAGER